MEIATTARGYRVAKSIGGSLLGRGADLIIIDDPIKGLAAALSETERRRVAEFYDNTLYSRLNNKAEGAIVIVMQRLHQDDLVGHVLEKDDWEVLSIPAIATEDTTHPLGPAWTCWCRRGRALPTRYARLGLRRSRTTAGAKSLAGSRAIRSSD